MRIETKTMNTLHTEANMMLTEREGNGCETERPVLSKGGLFKSSSMMGSTSSLRSARLPSTNSDDDLVQAKYKIHKVVPVASSHRTQPGLSLRLKRHVKRYLNRCLDGIFLRYVCCSALPLRAYLIFMTVIDTLLFLLDAINLANRIALRP